MTVFDFIVLVMVGATAIGGFMRGFVQEVLSLAAWGLAIMAIRFLHTDATALVYGYMGTPVSAAILAFLVLLLVPYIVVTAIARKAGKSARGSALGPIDRVLGFGFGAIKGVIVIIVAFSMLVLAFDTTWGPIGRPDWIVTARTYPFINASSEELVQLIEERRVALRGDEEVEGE